MGKRKTEFSFSDKSSSQANYSRSDFMSVIEKMDTRSSFQRTFYALSIVAYSIIAITLTSSIFMKDRVMNILGQQDQDQVQKILLDVDTLTRKISFLENNGMTSASSSAKYIDNRLTEIEKKQSSLSETLMSDADQVITPKLLMERYSDLQNRMDEVSLRQDKISEKYDTFTNLLILTPLFTFMFSVFGDKVKNFFSGKPTSFSGS